MANKYVGNNQHGQAKRSDLHSVDTPTFSRKTSKRSFSGLKMKPQIFKKHYPLPQKKQQIIKRDTGTSVQHMMR